MTVAHRLRTVGAQQLNRRHFVGRRRLAGERGEADRGELPLVAERRRRPLAVAHSVGMGMKRKSGDEPVGISAGGTAHCQPMIQSRPIGVVHTVSGDMQPCAVPTSCR